MKKRVWLLLPAMGLMMTGCSGSSAEEAVAELYERGYTYQKTTMRAADVFGDDGTYKLVMAGKVTNSPYEEYYKIIESTDDILYDEVYCYGEGENVTARYGVGGQWVEQTQKRSYPYGYDENLKFHYNRKEELEGEKVRVYTAKYNTLISDVYHDEKKIIATVEQEYYINEGSGQVQRIVTDLTDYNEKRAEYYAKMNAVNPITAKLKVSSKDHEEVEIIDILEISENVD